MAAQIFPKSLTTSKTRIRESFWDQVFLTIVYIVLTAILLVVLYPLVYILSASFSSPAAVSAGKVWLLPVQFSLKGYAVVFSNPQILTGYGNSLYYAFFGAIISVVMTILVAYPLSRPKLYGRQVILFFITFTMIFSGGLIPTYMVVKSLDMIDKRWALLIPGAVAAFYVIIARTFFEINIPEELAEAAELDGCSDLNFLWKVVIPLSQPIIAVLALMYAVGQWNSYFEALIYLKTSSLYPLQLVLRSILILDKGTGAMNSIADYTQRIQMYDLFKYTSIVVGSVPVLILYPFVQRYFVKGMLIGSLKG
jgi:putative aldouronate transport system permease protein